MMTDNTRSPSKFAKIELAAIDMGEHQTFAMVPGPAEAVNPSIWKKLNAAITQNMKIGIWYHAPYARESLHVSPLCPFGILIGHFHYLVGYSDNNHSLLTTYRLDRIIKLSIHKARFKRLRGITIEDVATRSFGTDLADKPQEIDLRVSRVASHEFKRFQFHPRQRVTEMADKSPRVEFTASGLKEICWETLRWEGHIKIVKPKALKTQMTRQLDLATKTLG